MARDGGPLQTSPGASVGPLYPNVALTGTFTVGAKAGTSFAGVLASSESIALGGMAGTAFAVGGLALAFSAGGIAGTSFGATLHLPVSFSVGAKAGTGFAITFPLSAAIGAKAGTGFSQHTLGPQTVNIGAKAGTYFFASTSAPAQIQLIPIQVTEGGGSYTSPPTVTVTGGAGTGATFRAILGKPGTPQAGTVVEIVQTNRGDGHYTGPVSVVISGGGGSGAMAIGSIQTQQSLVASQQRPLQVRLESYGVLTIETLTAPQQAETQPILPPPIRQPTQQQVPGGQQSPIPDTGNIPSRPWLTWYESVYRALGNAPGGPDSTIGFLCPSVDETDSEWYGLGTTDATTDPITVDVEFVNESRFGIEAEALQGGTGYTGATVLTLSGSGGTGFGWQGTPIIVMGSIVDIITTTSGYGYQPPLSLVATDTGGGSGSVLVAELGRQFGIGDYILWNDSTITAGIRSYEIDQITDIITVDATHATLTLARRPQGAPPDQAQYGSTFNAHTNCAFYRLINKLFMASANPTPGPQVCKFPWDNMTVTAVTATLPGLAPLVLSLAPTVYLPGTTNLDPRVNPPTPGLRTMNGAAYTNLGIQGTISVGQTSAARVSVQAHESIRTVYAKVLAAPTGPTAFNMDPNACIVIYVCFISPAGVVGLIDTLVIDASDFTSYSSSNVPDGRQMPYHFLWPFNAPNADWPPNRLPVCTGALTSGGLLQLPITIDPTQTVLFAPDGDIDFIVAQVGTSTAGANLVVTVQS